MKAVNGSRHLDVSSAIPGERRRRSGVALRPGGEIPGLIGRSAPMRQVFEQIAQLGAGCAPVFIAGETGTGKELIARALHHAGPRRAGPFVAINCAALPRDLIESELFGYARGAFSGAATDHVGLLRAASGGTLLLDELTEMSPALQAKLLRAVQDNAVRPVGAVAEVPVDVRFIASSNRDVEDALRNGLLRADLYYRLSVGLIAVPPLRERDGDVRLLAEQHLAILNQRYADPALGLRVLDADALELLRCHAWPGNVRELFNVLERAVIASRRSIIGGADLGLHSVPAEVGARPRIAAVATCAQHERALIERTLHHAGGNKTRAARQLGISRKKLYARIASYTRTESTE